MDSNDSIAVVVPCFNEAGRLPAKTFLEYLASNPAVTFYFVDDGSSDDTRIILQSICEQAGTRAKLILQDENEGKAVAVRNGMLEAVRGDYTYIAYWDADLSTPLDELQHLLHALKQTGSDWVMGSRLKILGCDINRHLHRHLAGRVFATFASMVLALPVYDTQCGAKVFANRGYLQALLREPFISTWTFDVELLMRYMLLSRMMDRQYRVIEVPLSTWIDIPGSKVTAWDFVSAIYSLWKIRLHYSADCVHEAYRETLPSTW